MAASKHSQPLACSMTLATKEWPHCMACEQLLSFPPAVAHEAALATAQHGAVVRAALVLVRAAGEAIVARLGVRGHGGVRGGAQDDLACVARAGDDV